MNDFLNTFFKVSTIIISKKSNRNQFEKRSVCALKEEFRRILSLGQSLSVSVSFSAHFLPFLIFLPSLSLTLTLRVQFTPPAQDPLPLLIFFYSLPTLPTHLFPLLFLFSKSALLCPTHPYSFSHLRFQHPK